MSTLGRTWRGLWRIFRPHRESWEEAESGSTWLPAAVTRQPIPWALVEDDPRGQPPLFRADADFRGVFNLVTLAEPHRIRVSAPGYRTLSLDIGRAWFVWMPRGSEKKNIEMLPLASWYHKILGSAWRKHHMGRDYPQKCVAQDVNRVLDSSWSV